MLLKLLHQMSVLKQPIEKIYNITLDEEKEVGNTNVEIWVELSVEPQNYKYALARTIGIKNER